MLKNGLKNSRVFIADVPLWIGDEPPTAQNLFQAKLYKFGFLHIKSIKEVGLPIVGGAEIECDSAPLSAESLELTTWGYEVPRALCERLLLSINL